MVFHDRELHLKQLLPGERRLLLWTAHPVMDNGQVLGALCCFRNVTGQATSLHDAHTLLEQAGHQIGTTLDIYRTAAELADLAVPALADRIVIDLLNQVLQGENLPRTDPGTLQFRRVAVRDPTGAKFAFAVGDLITVPVTYPPTSAVWREKPVLARNPAEIRRLAPYTPSYAEFLLAWGVHTAMAVPLIARDITLGMAAFSRAEHPEPYGEADVRLVSDLASRAAVHIDNARLYAREHNTAITLQRSLLPRHVPPVPGLQIAYRYQPASRTAEVGGDWFDVIPLNTGEVALVVGDVTGHGIHAAALMGQLRTTTAALARLGCPPGEIMAQLSGHYPATDTELPAGSVLALYTDGLIEHPGEDIGTGMARLSRALTASPARSPEHLCDSVLASLGDRARDDIALLLARTTTDDLYLIKRQAARTVLATRTSSRRGGDQVAKDDPHLGRGPETFPRRLKTKSSQTPIPIPASLAAEC